MKGTKTEKLMVVAVVLMVLVVGMLAFYMTRPLNISVNNPPAQQNNTFTLTKAWNFIVNDFYQGGAIGTSGLSITIFDSQLNTKETITSQTSSQWITTGLYHSGDSYWVKVSKTYGGVTWFKYYQLQVPYAGSGDSTQLDSQVDFYSLGNYSILINYPNGTSASSSYSKVYYVDATGNTVYPGFTVSIVETSTSINCGVQATSDPIYGINREFLLEDYMHDNVTAGAGTNRLQLTSVTLAYSTSATSKYYEQSLDPTTLCRVTNADGTIKQSGIDTIPITFNGNGLVTSDLVMNTFTLYFFTNLQYVKTYMSHPTGYTTAMSTAFELLIGHT